MKEDSLPGTRTLPPIAMASSSISCVGSEGIPVSSLNRSQPGDVTWPTGRGALLNRHGSRAEKALRLALHHLDEYPSVDAAARGVPRPDQDQLLVE